MWTLSGFKLIALFVLYGILTLCKILQYWVGKKLNTNAYSCLINFQQSLVSWLSKLVLNVNF